MSAPDAPATAMLDVMAERLSEACLVDLMFHERRREILAFALTGLPPGPRPRRRPP